MLNMPYCYPLTNLRSGLKVHFDSINKFTDVTYEASNWSHNNKDTMYY